MPRTDIASICLRARYAMAGTDMAYFDHRRTQGRRFLCSTLSTSSQHSWFKMCWKTVDRRLTSGNKLSYRSARLLCDVPAAAGWVLPRARNEPVRALEIALAVPRNVPILS
eukprot:3314559-Rhodomonas_salina.5